MFNIGLMPDIMSSQISDGSNENKNGDAIVLQDRAVAHISTLPTRALFSFFYLRDINEWDENESPDHVRFPENCSQQRLYS